MAEPTSIPTATEIDDCLCAIVETASDKLVCAAAKGVITVADYLSYMQNLDIHSVITIDPLTGSVAHGISATAPLQVILTLTNVLCNGDSTGTASAVVTGGVAPYTLVWEDVTPAVADPAILPAGSFTLTVTDTAGTSRVITFIITEPAALGLTTATTPDGGGGNGTATANVTGGTGPYTYEWRDNGGTPIVQTTRTATGLVAATYQVFVLDANGCDINSVNVIVA